MSSPALILEPDAETRDTLSALLRQLGLEPVAVEDPGALRGEIAARRPALIVLGGGGETGIDPFEICRELKCDPETNGPPVVVASPKGLDRDASKPIRVVADGSIRTPVDKAAAGAELARVLVNAPPAGIPARVSEIRFELRSEFKVLQSLNDVLTEMNRTSTRLTEKQVKHLRQAVHEMGSNAIEWGNHKNPDLPLGVTYRVSPDSVSVVIRDQGSGFNPDHLPHAASDEDLESHLDYRQEHNLREGGFGIMMARGLVDEFHYNDLGNEVTLVKRVEEAASGGAPASASAPASAPEAEAK